MSDVNIFVSYAHADSQWVQPGAYNLIPWLNDSLSRHGVTLWYDHELKTLPGEDYRKKILEEIERARFAILLISQNFANSDFIRTVELPALYRRAQQRELTAMPILVGFVDWEADREHLGWIQKLQILPDMNRPLISCTAPPATWDEVRFSILSAIQNRLRQKSRTEPGAAAPPPAARTRIRSFLVPALAVTLLAGLYLVLRQTGLPEFPFQREGSSVPHAVPPSPPALSEVDKKLDGMLATLLAGNAPLDLYVKPVVTAQGGYVTPFCEQLTARVHSLLAHYGNVSPVNTRAAIETRVESGRREQTARTAPSLAHLVGATAVLEGTLVEEGDAVHVRMRLTDAAGLVVGRAETSFESEGIGPALENNTAREIVQQCGGPTHARAQAVHIATTKGAAYQIYYTGEPIRFVIMASEKLCLYLYRILPEGRLQVLHPPDGTPPRVVQPGGLVSFPAADDPFEIQAGPPYGIEAVKVFACSRQIPAPRLDGAAMKPSALLHYFRSTAAQHGAELYEDLVFVDTRPR